MRTRIQASTDVAAFGIWDSAQPVAAADSTLEELARRGQACIVSVGRDCGGAVEVFVNEDIPAALLAESDPVAGVRTVVVRSGSVIIDGVERFGLNDASRASSTCRLPNGVYLAHIRVLKSDDELAEPDAERELRRIVGAEEVAYYDRTNRSGLLVGLGVLFTSLALLLWLAPWFVAAPVSLVLFVGYFHVQQWILKRNPRYRAIAERIVPLRLAGERPLLAVQLSPHRG